MSLLEKVLRKSFRAKYREEGTSGMSSTTSLRRSTRSNKATNKVNKNQSLPIIQSKEAAETKNYPLRSNRSVLPRVLENDNTTIDDTGNQSRSSSDIKNQQNKSRRGRPRLKAKHNEQENSLNSDVNQSKISEDEDFDSKENSVDKKNSRILTNKDNNKPQSLDISNDKKLTVCIERIDQKLIIPGNTINEHSQLSCSKIINQSNAGDEKMNEQTKLKIDDNETQSTSLPLRIASDKDDYQSKSGEIRNNDQSKLATSNKINHSTSPLLKSTTDKDNMEDNTGTYNEKKRFEFEKLPKQDMVDRYMEISYKYERLLKTYKELNENMNTCASLHEKYWQESKETEKKLLSNLYEVEAAKFKLENVNDQCIKRIQTLLSKIEDIEKSRNKYEEELLKAKEENRARTEFLEKLHQSISIDTSTPKDESTSKRNRKKRIAIGEITGSDPLTENVMYELQLLKLTETLDFFSLLCGMSIERILDEPDRLDISRVIPEKYKCVLQLENFLKGTEFEMLVDYKEETVDIKPNNKLQSKIMKKKIPSVLRKARTYHVDEIYLFLRDILAVTS